MNPRDRRPVAEQMAEAMLETFLGVPPGTRAGDATQLASYMGAITDVEPPVFWELPPPPRRRVALQRSREIEKREGPARGRHIH